MQTAKISSKRQISIPKKILDQYGLDKYSRVALESHSEGVLIKSIEKGSVVKQVAGSLTKYVAKSKLGRSWKSIMEETQIKTAKDLAQKK